MRFETRRLSVETPEGIGVVNITPQIRDMLAEAGLRQGFVVVSSNHTTTALAINENEERLLDDFRNFFSTLVPANLRYKHNDIHLRDCPEDEPENAHSHIMAVLLGSSESIPVDQGALQLGEWQSVLLFELDGPRSREVKVQLVGE